MVAFERETHWRLPNIGLDLISTALRALLTVQPTVGQMTIGAHTRI